MNIFIYIYCINIPHSSEGKPYHHSVRGCIMDQCSRMCGPADVVRLSACDPAYSTICIVSASLPGPAAPEM